MYWAYIIYQILLKIVCRVKMPYTIVKKKALRNKEWATHQNMRIRISSEEILLRHEAG